MKTVIAYEYMTNSPYTYDMKSVVVRVTKGKTVKWVVPEMYGYEGEDGLGCRILSDKDFRAIYSLEHKNYRVN
jgi:hypothetical protein